MEILSSEKMLLQPFVLMLVFGKRSASHKKKSTLNICDYQASRAKYHVICFSYDATLKSKFTEVDQMDIYVLLRSKLKTINNKKFFCFICETKGKKC